MRVWLPSPELSFVAVQSFQSHIWEAGLYAAAGSTGFHLRLYLMYPDFSLPCVQALCDAYIEKI